MSMPVEANILALLSLHAGAPEQPGPWSQQGGPELPGPWHQPRPRPRPLCARASSTGWLSRLQSGVPSKLGDRAGLARLKRRWRNKRRPCGPVWQEPVAGRRAGKGRRRREGCSDP